MESAEIDWSRFDTEEAVRGLNKEEREMRLDEISTIIDLQGKINELKTTLEIIKRQREEDDDRLCRERYQKNKKEREERKEQERVNEKWEKIEKIRIKEERKPVREWKQQEIWKRKREENRKRAIEERKYFGCGVIEHSNTNNFYSLFFYFSDFTLLFFYFLLKDDEKGT